MARIKQKTLHWVFRLLLPAGLLLGQACGLAATEGSEVAAPAAQSDITRVQGARLAVEYGSWPGDAEVYRWVTPVYLKIENRSQTTLRFLPRDFRLVGGGQHARLIPPEDFVAGGNPHATAAHAPQLRMGYQVAAPSDGTQVMPTFDESLPSSAPAVSVQALHALAEHAEQLQQLALQSSIVAPGQRVEGFVYFQRVPMHPESASLFVNLVALDGTNLGEASLRFSPEALSDTQGAPDRSGLRLPRPEASTDVGLGVVLPAPSAGSPELLATPNGL